MFYCPIPHNPKEEAWLLTLLLVYLP